VLHQEFVDAQVDLRDVLHQGERAQQRGEHAQRGRAASALQDQQQ